MKRSKIIFSMVFMAMAFISSATMAQTRVIISTGIVAPYGYPPPGYGYAPQPVYYPPCGVGYYAPRPQYRQGCGNHHHAYNNNYNNNYGNRNGYGNGNRNGRGNYPRHY